MNHVFLRFKTGLWIMQYNRSFFVWLLYIHTPVNTVIRELVD